MHQAKTKVRSSGAALMSGFRRQLGARPVSRRIERDLPLPKPSKGTILVCNGSVGRMSQVRRYSAARQRGNRNLPAIMTGRLRKGSSRSVRLRDTISAAPELVALVKRVLSRLLGEQAIGVINYIRSPERGSAWGGPFNGQSARQARFRMIIKNTRPRAIVETGTYLGITTEFMVQTGLAVFTIEAHPRYYGFARARFWHKHRITLIHADSRSALREIFAGPLHSLESCTLFYLDAHWNDDLPLAEEIGLVDKV